MCIQHWQSHKLCNHRLSQRLEHCEEVKAKSVLDPCFYVHERQEDRDDPCDACIFVNKQDGKTCEVSVVRIFRREAEVRNLGCNMGPVERIPVLSIKEIRDLHDTTSQ